MTTDAQTKILEELEDNINKYGISNIVDDFIRLLIDKKNQNEKIASYSLQKTYINSGNSSPEAKSKSLDALEKLSASSKEILSEINIKLPVYTTKITTAYNSSFVSEIQTDVDAIPTGRADKTDIARVTNIRKKAERSFSNAGFADTLSQYKKTPFGMRSTGLVSQMAADVAKKIKEQAEKLKSELPTSPNQQLLTQLNKLVEEKTKVELEYKALVSLINTAQGNLNPTAPPIEEGEEISAQGSGDSVQAAPQIKIIYTEKVQISSAENLFSPTVKSSPSNLFSEASNPLQHAVVGTQLLYGDKIDPRKIDFFVPQSYVTHVPAYMSIIRGTSPAAEKYYSGTKEIPTISSPFGTKGQKNSIYNQFSLTQTIEMYSEKFQVDDTMSEGNIVYFFGQRPEIWTFSGTLLNDLLHAWHPKFREIWHNQLRGSVLAKNNSYLAVIIPSSWLMLLCYPIGMSISHTVDMENISPFTMSVFVKKAVSLPNLETRLVIGKEENSPVKTSIVISDILNDLNTADLSTKYKN